MPIRKKAPTAPVLAPAAVLAGEPSRATGKFTLTLGLLSVPLDVFTATEDITVKREQYLADGSKVGMCPAVKNDDGTYGDKVARDEIVKRLSTEHGLVEVSDAEIDSLSTVVGGTADVLGVMPLTLLGSRYVPNGKVWQARAGKLGSGRAAKPNPGGEQAYSLLLQGLEAKGSFILVRWARAGSAYLSALLPSGRLVGLFHDNEVRSERALPTSAFGSAEIDMAVSLLSMYDTEPVIAVNDIPTKVLAYATTKASTGEVLAPAEAPQPTASVTDLMASLTASVAAAKAMRVAV